MALKRNHPPLAMFSMSSLTDIIFLLLIFFMVTSTVIQPSAIDVSLPQSDNQTTLKPVTEVYIDSLGNVSMVENKLDSIGPGADLIPIAGDDDLSQRLMRVHETDSTRAVALYADQHVEYRLVVNVLNIANRHNLRTVLATRPDYSR
ncbi:MAG: biopolymer transporter ExbD [Clostridium sp.]|nr:biopolymer transporter ExbD [Prevotella sp.]MCM1428547.1 biopolymer transporter ExbD [Clostridium sp.]MCM1475011.1 biopolymer transporter ExbD [Muribaculaceae bacterium]